jgi:putative ABC transport system permease protein
MRRLLARLRALVRRDVVAGEIRDEMQFHLQMRAEQYQRQGLTSEQARRTASRRFGNLALMQDRGYDVRGGGVMETILQDIRYGARLLIKDRSFSIVAIVTLALAIGPSTALFSVMDAALLRPLPYPHPEQLVDVLVRESRAGQNVGLVPSLGDIRAWRQQARSIAHVGAGRVTGFVPRIVDAGTPERLVVGDVSEDFLDVFGIRALAGRTIQQDDLREGTPLVAVLGHAYWVSHFGAAPDVLGRVIRVDNAPATIVGVLPPGFYRETAVWVPSQVPTARIFARGSGTPVNARLRPGVTLTDAERELAEIGRNIPTSPGHGNLVAVQLTSMYEEETSGSRKTLGTLVSAVSLILLIACVNVAALLLARGAIRQPELAVRGSIGASRPRLVRQLLTENLLLSCASGLLGVLLAWGSLDAIVALLPLSLPSNSQPKIDIAVLGFAAGLSILSSLLFGLVPAIRTSRAQVGPQLAKAGRRHGSALSRRAGQLLIGAQVALAVVLLAAAGLMVRSFARLTSVDIGFDPGGVLTMEVEPLERTPVVRYQYYPALLTKIREIPQIAVAGAIDFLPLRDGYSVAFTKGQPGTMLVMKHVLPGYFEAIGQRLQAGRLPAEEDRAAAENVAVINEAAASTLFRGSSAVGRVLETVNGLPSRIIGVVADVKLHGPEWPAKPEVYFLYTRQGSQPAWPLRIVFRPRPGASVPADRLRQAVESVGPKVLLGRIRPASDDLSQTMITPRHRTLLLTLLGGLGLLLTLVGIFSMTAYAVARRTQEIGVRMAFGARAADVVRTMIREAAWPALLGLLGGVLGAMYATRIVASFLFQTTPHDPVTLGAVAGLMAAAALLAAWIPARRAARVDPIVALRAE